jgi:hypothetical protein
MEVPDGYSYAWNCLNAKFEQQTKANLIGTKKEFTEYALKDVRTDSDILTKNLEFLRRSLDSI